MKKIKFSLIVAFAILAASLSAFTGKPGQLTNTWYGQESDAVPPYDLSFPLTLAQLNSKCPQATQHICAVEVDMNGDVIATRKSAHNYIP